MLKINLILISMLILYCGGTIIESPIFKNQYTLLGQDLLKNKNEQPPLWQAHVMDFLKLIDLERVLSTVIRFIGDSEVMRFIGFLLSPKFKDMIWELESMDEFKEAYLFLINRGYDVQSVLDYVNAGLSLPQFNKPKMDLRYEYNAGVSGFLAAMIGTLPIKDMEELLKHKVENSTEVAEFLDVIKSPEFMDIIKRMFGSPKFVEFKSIFESYGVDFSSICEIIQEIAGEDYEGFVCKNSHENIFT